LALSEFYSEKILQFWQSEKKNNAFLYDIYARTTVTPFGIETCSTPFKNNSVFAGSTTSNGMKGV
jgi:hypothetical protein